jgi:hypothetical protein
MFEEFPKISRLSRPIVITEKIDGSNGQLLIQSYEEFEADFDPSTPQLEPHIFTNRSIMRVGSRKRWLDATKQGDHFGFYKWAEANMHELIEKLGPGRHYGEWWGQGIQRNYGINDKRFSLFNTHRWNDETKPECCHVVPILLTAEVFDTPAINAALTLLGSTGSRAAPGFMNPEGVVIYHPHGNMLMKKTFKGDDAYVPGKKRADG